MALVTVQNLTTSPLSTDVGLLSPGETKALQMGPAQAYRAAEGLKVLSDAGRVSVTIAEEAGKLDALEPAAVGTASVADLAVTTAKLAAGAVTSAKLAALAVDSAALGSAAVIAGKIAAGGVSAANQFAAGVVDATALGALAVTTAKINAAAVTKAKALVSRSAEQTGTGAPQNVAHGLAAVPSVVMWSLTDAPAGAFVVTEGAHDATNVIVTATSGLKFVVLAWA